MWASTEPIGTLILVAALMILDYALTLKGQTLYHQQYGKHIKSPSYELNPKFKSAIKARRYHWMHAASLILTGALISLAFWLGSTNRFFVSMTTYEFLSGILISMFAYVNVRHLQNILLFKKLNAHPTLVRGTLHQTPEFSLYSGKVHAYGAALLLFFVWIFNPTWFAFGFAFGPFIIGRKHTKWAKEK